MKQSFAKCLKRHWISNVHIQTIDTIPSQVSDDRIATQIWNYRETYYTQGDQEEINDFKSRRLRPSIQDVDEIYL